jgi:four helix bundle protein
VKSEKDGIKERSYKFALRILNLGKSLPKSRAGDVLGRQITRSGTSIGANVEEAIGAFSKEDFTFKMNTALKEARETQYWLRLTRDSNLVAANRMESLIQEAEEITKILGAIVRSSRAKK